MRGLRAVFACLCWCMVLPALDAQACSDGTVPNKCNCTEVPVVQVNCTATDLQVIPTNLPPVVNLTIEQNSITIVENIPYADLINLHLRQNQIRFITNYAFSALDKLIKLDLANNRLSGLVKETFDGLDSLNFLFLDGNTLNYIQADLFSHETLPKLTHLRLSNCQLFNIEEGAFSGLNRLMKLDVDTNHLKVAPRLVGLTALDALDLSHNEIYQIPMSAFEGVTSLRHLHLHHNQLKVLNDDTFAGLTSLTQLELADNYITAISENALLAPGQIADLDLQRNQLTSLLQSSVPSKLTRLSIANNTWDCTCDIGWMRQDDLIPQWNPKNTMICASPEQAAGQSIWDADEHLFECNSILRGFHGNTVAMAVGIVVAVCVFLLGIFFLVKMARQRTRNSGARESSSPRHASYRRVKENNIFNGDRDDDYIL